LKLASLTKKADTYLIDHTQVGPVYQGSFKQSIIESDPGYKFYRYSDLIINTLERVLLPKDHPDAIRRLLVMCQPQLGKSELVTRKFPAYYLRKNPQSKNALVSYESGIAYGFSRAVRSHYLEMGGKLKPGAAAVKFWESYSGGQMWAASAGGSLTSKGFNGIGVIDDPLKGVKESLSDSIRENQKVWYHTDFTSRGSGDYSIIVVQTRWHVSDLTGFLLAQEAVEPEHWHVIVLDAIKEADPYPLPSTCTLIPDWREPGEVVCPERFSLQLMEQRREKMPSYFWNALYQQRPVAESSQIFNRQTFQYWSHPLPDLHSFIIAVDASFKETISGSYVVIQLWGVGVRGYFLLDQIRDRMGFSDTCKAVVEMKDRWESLEFSYSKQQKNQYVIDKILIEDKANGPAIIDELRNKFSDLLLPWNPGSNSKVGRARAIENYFKTFRVFFPYWFQDPANAEIEEEIVSFPLYATDDVVDCLDMALIHYSGAGSAENLLDQLLSGTETLELDEYGY
jgi:hypothetical protein